jgi:single-strand DNA-binding protein
MNNVAMVGRLTKDMEIRYTPNGKAVATGTIAVQRNFKNQDGEYEADFINFVVWGKIAEMVAEKTEKGGRFGGTGRMQSRSYEAQDGRRVYVTEFVIENVEMVDWAGQGGQRGNFSNENSQGGGQSYTRVDDDPFANNGETIDIKDDDLPF